MNHIDPLLETMSVVIRPFWTPHEVSCIVLLLVHAIVFDSPSSKVVKETRCKIHEQLDNLEKSYPNSTIYALGDFNSVSINLPRFKQQVTCTTRNDRTLDKCYVTTKANAYKCYKLPSLGTSDHDAVMMIPKYTPTCKSQPTYITKQLWSSDNMEKLIDCLEDTD